MARDGYGLVIDAITRRQADRRLTPDDFDPHAQVGKILLESCGGAIDDIAPDATAFPHRGMIYLAQYQSRWLPGAGPAVAEANIAWTRDMYDSVAAYRSGASYVELHRPRPAGLADRPTTGRTCRVFVKSRAATTPTDVFQFAQSIPLP